MRIPSSSRVRLASLLVLLVPLGGCPAPAEVGPIEGPVIGPQIPSGPAAERSTDLDAARELDPLGLLNPGKLPRPDLETP